MGFYPKAGEPVHLRREFPDRHAAKQNRWGDASRTPSILNVPIHDFRVFGE
jgi:hypothetical protein